MTKEQLQERITKLTQEREQVKATLAAYEGAIQESTFWLSQLDQPTEDKNDGQDSTV